MASTRLLECFKALQSQGRKALIPYVTAGDPSPDATVNLMHTLVASGADVIELGVPFSDPMADGPVIQRSSERALARGVSLLNCLDWVKTFRETDNQTPVVLMGYANPIERFDGLHGQRAFVNAAKAAGVDGILVVDYPPEECESFAADLRAQDMDLIFLLAPTSTDERMALVGKLATGYVYYVSLKGVTGAGHLDTDAVAAMLPRIRQFIKIPVGVGFGIRDAATAKGVGIGADAVVIGSKVIQIAEGESEANVGPAVGAFLTEIRQALDTLPPL